MSRRSAVRAGDLARKTAETWIAAPQVVAHRLGRLAAAGATPSARDRREFHRMGAEKIAAFQESWMAMGLQVVAHQQRMAASWLALWAGSWRAAGNPLAVGASLLGPAAVGRSLTDLSHAWIGIAGRGLAPVHRRAVANARRLSTLHIPAAVATPVTRRATTGPLRLPR